MATISNTKAKRVPGAISSQCAATKSKIAAPSNTPPSATASIAGQRRRSPVPRAASNARIFPAVSRSSTPADTHRSSLFCRLSATGGPPSVNLRFRDSRHYPYESFVQSCRTQPSQAGAPSWRPFLVRNEHARFGVIRRRHVVERHVDVFALRAAVFDQHRGDALGNFALHFRCAAFHPRNLHMRHGDSSLERAAQRFLQPISAFRRTAIPRYLCASITDPCILRFLI